VDSVNKKAADIQRLNFWLKRQEFNSIYDVFCCSACLKCCTKCCTLRAKTGHKWHILCAALKYKLLILFKKLAETAGIGHPGQPIRMHAYWRFGLQTARRCCSFNVLRPDVRAGRGTSSRAISAQQNKKPTTRVSFLFCWWWNTEPNPRPHPDKDSSVSALRAWIRVFGRF
jgi:hypothetical protein